MTAFLKPRLPFELAEPGTDPTTLPNPHPKKSWRDVLPWIAAGIVFLFFGYVKFIKKPDSSSSQARAETSPVTVVETPAPTPTRFTGQGGFFPDQTPTPTLIATVTATTPTPTLTPMPTPTPDGYVSVVYFGVFVDGEQVTCFCDATGIVGPLDVCVQFTPQLCRPDEQAP
jgi:hypothetical protein